MCSSREDGRQLRLDTGTAIESSGLVWMGMLAGASGTLLKPGDPAGGLLCASALARLSGGDWECPLPPST